MNAQERNRDHLRRLYDEVINPGDLERADVYLTPDRPDNDPNLPPEMTRDREGFKLFFRMFRAAFPDQKFTFCRFNAEGLIAEHWGLFDQAAMLRQLS